MRLPHGLLVALLVGQITATAVAAEPLLLPQKLLNRETFWDNQDWYAANIPFFECPDADIQTTYYYRCELLTKHLTCGSPKSEFAGRQGVGRRTEGSGECGHGGDGA